MHTFTFSISLLYASAVASAYPNGIDPRDVYEEMEHIMVDNGGTNNDAFVDAVTPCSNYVGFASNGSDRGEQSSAQWTRIVFHDFVTANVTAGTGGLDASIGYESERTENAGLFVNDTLQFMLPTVSAYLSMADNIALGIVVSIASCENSTVNIPVRTGRIDATEAGPAGVPGPLTGLEATLAQFEAAGFDQSDTIAVTACGHSLGRIHYSNFPEIVDKSAVTDTNLDGGVGFDSTPDVFDASVVNEFLNGTGKQGGLLVTAANVSERSDYRLYTSDLNATLQSIAEEYAFRTKCFSLFERMINTVPATVTLSDPVTPLIWKGVNVIMDINSTGAVSVSGLIRYLYTSITPPEVIYYTTTSTAGNSSNHTSDTTSGNGTSLYGSTQYWPFNSTITQGTTSLNFEDVSYPINDEIFILPAQSLVNSTTNSVTLRAASLTSLASSDEMTGVLYVPTAVQGALNNAIQNATVSMSEYGTAGNYTLYEGSVVTTTVARSVIAKVIMGDSASRTLKINLFGSD